MQEGEGKGLKDKVNSTTSQQWLTRLLTHTAGKRCLELGCGAGLVGVALARLGARALLTDGCGPTVQNCVRNLALNGVRASLLAEQEAADAWLEVRM